MWPDIAAFFAAGGHHTLESLPTAKLASAAESYAAIERRFGAISETGRGIVDIARSSVGRAISSASSLMNLAPPNLLEYGYNPAAPQQYQYTVLAQLPDARFPGRNIDVPWTINSEEQLTYQQILNQAELELSGNFRRSVAGSGDPTRAENADLIRRDEAFKRELKDQYGGFMVADITILSAYRR